MKSWASLVPLLLRYPTAICVVAGCSMMNARRSFQLLAAPRSIESSMRIARNRLSSCAQPSTGVALFLTSSLTSAFVTGALCPPTLVTVKVTGRRRRRRRLRHDRAGADEKHRSEKRTRPWRTHALQHHVSTSCGFQKSAGHPPAPCLRLASQSQTFIDGLDRTSRKADTGDGLLSSKSKPDSRQPVRGCASRGRAPFRRRPRTRTRGRPGTPRPSPGAWPAGTSTGARCRPRPRRTRPAVTRCERR